MKITAAPCLSFLVLASTLYAQESLVGKYAGTFVVPTNSRGMVPLAISLDITSAADGKLQAKALRSQSSLVGQGCAGEYDLEGTYQGNKIDMKSGPGGPAKDCFMRLRLVAQGNKLTGKLGTFDVEFVK
jgi:hypothetical protein